MKKLQDYVSDAKAAVEAITVEAARGLHGRDDVTFIDVREPPETAKGKIEGAEAIPRGTLEFAVDGPQPNPALSDKSRTYIFYCAAGGRAAMAAARAKEMGFEDARAIDTGYPEWAKQGGPTE
ncbi:rhodanese-like domain-containing protein [Roseobacter sp. HKCCA0434]|uniref:rhodanese-like domain-containing protein n=1 Tax=Roseobacter sp. HKCCA0434 TaxID=3079297 RepID=UPI002905BD9B|nr:rhodanese-like domain-containing protein [Roseobacter sp. HKCCA0434]